MTNTQSIKNYFKKIEPLRSTYSKFYKWRLKFYLKFNPKIIANSSYKFVFKKNINWENPIDLIEKIQWLQIYSDTSLWTICADKYLVRAFVKGKGCGYVLNELYGAWYNVDHIDWSKLPNSFVLKGNNSCGEVILVKDKNKLDKIDTKTQLKTWMKTVYGYNSAQLHYTRIKPCIIAEKLLINKKNPEKSLIDYKIWCFHGVPESILVSDNRTENDYSLSFYDLEWNNISDIALNKNNTHYCGKQISKPKSFDKMIEVAKILSKDFPQVRVDFYDLAGKAIFGEMTFTTGFGSYSDEYYKYLGNKIDLNKVDKLPRLNSIKF